MIKRLRKRIIIATLTIVFVLLFAIMFLVLYTNFINISNDANDEISLVYQSDEVQDKIYEITGEKTADTITDEEDLATFRYCVGFIYEDNTSQIDIDHLYYKSETTIENKRQEYLEIMNSLPKEYGFYNFSLAYRHFKSSTMDIYILVDCTKQLNTAKNFMIASIYVAILTIIIVIIIVYIFAYRITEPIAVNYENQKKFIANARHEMKTPLTVININNQLLQLELGEDNESTQAISGQIKRLNNMVMNMSILTKVNDEFSEKETKLFDYSEDLHDLIVDTRKTYPGERTLNLYCDNNVIIKGNENLLKQLYSILIENAYKYSKTHIDITLLQTAKNIIFIMSNDADDVEEGPLPNVFERFFRTSEVRAKQIEGSGIGLSIAKDIAEFHKAKIEAYGHNGTFNIKVTFKRPKDTKKKEEKPKREAE